MITLRVLMIALLATWVVLSTVAEMAHAWRSRTFRTLRNTYTVGFALSVVVLLVQFTLLRDGHQTSMSRVMVSSAVASLAIYMIGVHAGLRGALLLCDLIGLGQNNAKRVALKRTAQRPLPTCLVLACFVAVGHVVCTGGYVYMWIWLKMH